MLASVAANAAVQRAEEILVTATRVEQAVGEVIGATSIITREDIEQRMVHSTQDLLRGETGIDVVNSGGLGKLSNVYLRGTDAEQVLILVDGVRVGSATAGTTPLEYLPVDQIERIEIVRGPRSSLYGADAIGGVIQIFTRRAQGPAFSIGTGSHDTYKASASFGASSERAWFSLSGNRIQSEGYNSCNGAPFVPGGSPGGGCFTYEPDRDGYDNTSGALRAGYGWGDRARIEASALYATGTTEFDGSFSNETEFTQQVFTLRGDVQLRQNWNLSLVAGNSQDKQDNFLEDPFSDAARLEMGRFDTEKRHASLQSDLELSTTQLLSLGVDYVDDRVDSSTPYDESSRDNVGVFAQYQARFGAHQAMVSARSDENEQFGSYSTGSIGWKWNLPHDLSLTAAWGNAFGAPTFNDLYYPGFSNPDLQPETSHSYELGLSGQNTALRWSLAAFENRIDHLIVYDSVLFAPNNLEEARIRGVEADASLAWGAWSMQLGYTGLDPRNRSTGANKDKILPRRARHYGHLEVGRSFTALDARLRLTAAGARYDTVANTARLGSYATLDLMLDYAFDAHWSMQGKVGNLLDRNYQSLRYYNQDDRTFFVGVRYQP